MKNLQKIKIHGELALAAVIVLNSLGVVLMLYSGSGISAISSVPYAFSLALPFFSLGTWTYIFQGLLVLSLLILQKKLVWPYLFSFIVGFAFGVFVDIHELWTALLPRTMALRIIYFLIGYLLIAFGIALTNRCRMPIIPTDLFPREFSKITGLTYAKTKITFDVTCLAATALITLIALKHLSGLGIGTVAAAFTMGKAISEIGKLIDRKFYFVSFLDKD